MKLWGPLMDVATAGNDTNKYYASVQKLLTATDTVASELAQISNGTSDAELKTGISAMMGDVQKMKMAVNQYGKDQKKLESILSSGNFNTGSDHLEKLCAG